MSKYDELKEDVERKLKIAILNKDNCKIDISGTGTIFLEVKDEKGRNHYEREIDLCNQTLEAIEKAKKWDKAVSEFEELDDEYKFKCVKESIILEHFLEKYEEYKTISGKYDEMMKSPFNEVLAEYMNKCMNLEQKNQVLKDRFKRISNDFDNLVKENDRLEQENQVFKDFVLYCINEIHKWGCDYYGEYPNQELINNISNYLNEKEIKAMLEIVEVKE